ncbi:MAG: DUF357 domain-containing protein [Methanobacteriales archaeon]|nr:DUF357 domain-containing protein [Methanobacteriales archaeon]
MDALERIDKDLKLFEKNIKELESIKMDVSEEKIVNLAKSYAQDTTYYLKKEDYLTAFGCITYAHGLLDAVRLIKGLI